MTLDRHLDSIRTGTVPRAFGALGELRSLLRRDAAPAGTARRLLAHCGEDADALAQILLIHALAEIEDPLVDRVFAVMLSEDSTPLREHVAWALGRRSPSLEAIPGLIRQIVAGGFGGILAQLTLESWTGHNGGEGRRLLREALLCAERPAARARLIETLGRFAGTEELMIDTLASVNEAGMVRAAAARALSHARFPTARTTLAAATANEDEELRLAAIEALGDLAEAGDARAVEVLRSVSQDGRVDPLSSASARQALHSAWSRPWADEVRKPGLRLARLDLQRVGGDETDGTATGEWELLRDRLEWSLGERPEIARTFTITRAAADSGAFGRYSRLLVPIGAGTTSVRLPFGPEGDLDSGQMWPHRVAIEVGFERFVRRYGPLDGVLLGAADAGSLAVSRVCRRLEIPCVFDPAVEPPAALTATDHRGRLDRVSFVDADRDEHYLFRAWLLEQAEEAASLPTAAAHPLFEQIPKMSEERQIAI